MSPCQCIGVLVCSLNGMYVFVSVWEGDGSRQMCHCTDMYLYVGVHILIVQAGVHSLRVCRNAMCRCGWGCAGVGMCPNAAVPHSTVPQFPYLRINSTPISVECWVHDSFISAEPGHLISTCYGQGWAGDLGLGSLGFW